MKIFGNFEKAEKQEDGTIIVSGIASSEALDNDGEVIKADAIAAAIPDYMKFANIREMHQPKAAGTAIEISVMDDGRTFLKAHIVDSEAVKKVENNVYKGFSIGGRVTERDATDPKIIKGLRLSEISLVDRPCNPEAVFTFSKVDDDEKAAADMENEGGKTADPKPEAAAGATAAAAGTSESETSKSDTAAATASTAAIEKADDVKKGMYGIAWLADILTSINCLQSDAQWEAEYEKDGSGLPAAIKAWLVQGGELLKTMVNEEVAELTGANETAVADVIVLAEKAKGLIKVACTPEESEKFNKGLDILLTKGNTVTKAGARNSAADKKHINAIHDAALALGADCGNSDKAAGNNDDLQKAYKLTNELAKVLDIKEGEDVLTKVNELVSISNTLAAELSKLQNLPKPSKAIVKAVEKGGDSNLETQKLGGEKEAEPKTAQEAIKKVWQGKPVLVYN